MTDGLGADVVMEVVGVPETIAPSWFVQAGMVGRGSRPTRNKPTWRRIVISPPPPVDTASTPTLLKLAPKGA